ncbi:uncharacterized protein LOC144643798 isoform X1 [Oculina patagonica]
MKIEYACTPAKVIFRIMSQCLKFLLLVTIVLYIPAISAKRYDIKICVTPYRFAKILHWHCSNIEHKRTITKEALVKPETEAKNFLTELSRREPVAVKEGRRTDYYEECCMEGCTYMEILEYCRML